MKKIQYIFAAILLLIAASACDNFESLNTNPNNSTAVKPDMIATKLMVNAYRFWNPNSSDFSSANLWCKHTAMVQKDANPYQYYWSYWPYGSINFKFITDANAVVEFAEGTSSEDSFKGLALFLKATSGFGKTLDLGDIPYSEAGRALEGIMQPKYDKQEDVFMQVLADLKTAEELFAKGQTFGGDIMYNGDASKWRKLCNVTQLKVLQTISKKITPEQKKRFAEIVVAGNLMTSNDDIFQLVYTDSPNASHPYWNGESTRKNNAVSNLVVDELKRLKDRRLFIFAEPADTLIRLGKLPSDYDAYVGAEPQLTSDSLNRVNSKGGYSLINKRYVNLKSGDPMLRFTYAEQCFILAEAVEEGWISGSAKDYYEKGVRAMLSYYMTLPSAAINNHGMPISQDYINSYMTGSAAYLVSGTKTERLQQVWMQRWLIDFFQGNGGNYAQVLRTGYPKFPLDPKTSKNPHNASVYPTRWMYPTGELTTNAQNYKKAIEQQYGGQDLTTGIPWYLQ